MSDTETEWRRYTGPALGAAVLLVYGQCLSFSFTNWDDPQYILQNPVLLEASWETLRQVLRPGTIPGEVLYIPVTYLSFWLERALFELAPWAVHLTNVLLHLISTLLVWKICERLSGGWLAGVVAAVVFGFHPLQVEAVAWASGRKDVLSAAFSLAAMWSFLDRRWTLCILLAIVAMFAKPVAIVLPGVLVVLALAEGQSLTRGRLVAIGGVGCAGLICLLLNQTAAPLPGDAPVAALRLAHVPWILTDWLQRLSLWQPSLHYYEWPAEFATLAWVGAGLILTAVAGVGWAAWRKQYVIVAGASCVALFLLPQVKLLLSYREFITADRYTYMAMFGVALVVCLLFERMAVKRSGLARCCAGLLALALVLPTVMNLQRWESASALWEYYKEYRDSGFAYHQLGRAYLDAERDWTEIVPLWEVAADKLPEDPEVLFDLGNGYTALGRNEDAFPLFVKALSLRPDYVEAMVNAGRAALLSGRPKAAVTCLSQAVAYDTPFRCEVYGNLVQALLAAGDPTAAEAMRLEAVTVCGGVKDEG